MSISCTIVKCKKCTFQTSNAKQEGDHIIVESIREIKSKRVKQIANVLHEKTNLNTEEFKDLFDELMLLMGYTEKFVIVDCMEIVKENE